MVKFVFPLYTTRDTTIVDEAHRLLLIFGKKYEEIGLNAPNRLVGFNTTFYTYEARVTR